MENKTEIMQRVFKKQQVSLLLTYVEWILGVLLFVHVRTQVF
jgi:hypothetical protein